jgi:Tfp pilus assembly protein PilF
MVLRRIWDLIATVVASVVPSGCASHVDPPVTTNEPNHSSQGSPNARRQDQCAQELIDLGNHKATQGDLPGAILEFTRAIEADPANALAWTNRGNTYGALGQSDKALADCSKAVELKPSWSIVWYNRANI